MSFNQFRERIILLAKNEDFQPISHPICWESEIAFHEYYAKPMNYSDAEREADIERKISAMKPLNLNWRKE